MNVVAPHGEPRGRGIERALAHVEEYWIPFNPLIQSQLAETLAKAPREWSGTQVLELLKQDLSLFLQMIRSLTESARELGRVIPASPVELFNDCDADAIRCAFNKVIARPQRNRPLETAIECQAERLEEAYVSASASEVLAGKAGLGSDLGYAGAIIRQLGLTLIAFNYPTIFEEVVNSLPPEKTLDLALAERLGFSPTLLTYRLLDRWGIAHELRDISVDEELEDNVASQISTTLRQLCEVGEALARANNPAVYSNASKDWEFARSAVESALGKNGINLIRRCLEKNTKKLAKAMPQIFKGGLVLEPEMRLAQKWEHDHLQLNPFLSACEPHYRDSIHRLYDKLLSGSDVSTSLAYLVKEVIPHAGLGAGCLFTADPSTQALVPQLRVGQPQHRNTAPVSGNSEHDIVARAFASFTPITDKAPDGTLLIAGVVGYSNRIGVLYFEVPPSPGCLDPIAHFRALTKSFGDTLRLR